MIQKHANIIVRNNLEITKEELVLVINKKGRSSLKRNLIESIITTPTGREIIHYTSGEQDGRHNFNCVLEHLDAKYNLKILYSLVPISVRLFTHRIKY